MKIAHIVNSFFGLYFWLIILRIFLTWIPTIEWKKQPFKFLRIIVDAFLSPFRMLIPSVGGLDFSPIVAIIFLQFVQTAVVKFLAYLGV